MVSFIITPSDKSVQVDLDKIITIDLVGGNIPQTNVTKLTVQGITLIDGGAPLSNPNFTTTVQLSGGMVTRIQIQPTINYASYTIINIYLKVLELSNESTEKSFSFTTKDTQGPVFINRIPEANSLNNVTNTPIVFRIVDANSGASFKATGSLESGSNIINNIAAVDNMTDAVILGEGIPSDTSVLSSHPERFDGYTTTDGYIKISKSATITSSSTELTFLNFNATINNVPAVYGGSFQEPFRGSITVVDSALDVYIARDNPFMFEESVTVAIRAFDQDGYGTTEWSFNIIEGQEPNLIPVSPLNNAINVERDASIILNLQHPGEIALNTLNMWINGVRVFTDGTFNLGGLLGWTRNFETLLDADGYDDGYILTVQPPNTFFTSSQLVKIIAYVEDIRANLGAINYQFRIENFLGPQIENQLPSVDALNILPSTDIRFTLTESQDGYSLDNFALYDIDFASLSISIDGYDVYKQGFESYYDGYDTFSQSLEEDGDGYITTYPFITKIIHTDIYKYDFIISPQIDFGFNQAVSVNIAVSDKQGELNNINYSFTTAPFNALITTASPSTATFKNLLDGYGLQLGREFLTQVGVVLTPNFVGNGYGQHTITYYTLDGSIPNVDRYGRVLGSTQVYSGPIKLQREGLNVLKFRSGDKAGNLEDVKQEVYMLEPFPPRLTSSIFNISQFSRQLTTTDPVPIELRFYDNATDPSSLLGPVLSFTTPPPGEKTTQTTTLSNSVCIITWAQVSSNVWNFTVDLDLSSSDLHAIFADGTRNVFISVRANNSTLSPRQHILPTASISGLKAAKIFSNITNPTTVIPIEKIMTGYSVPTDISRADPAAAGAYTLLFKPGDLVRILDDVRPPITTKVLLVSASANPPFIIVQDAVQKLRTSRNARVELITTPLQSSSAVDFDTRALPETFYIGSDGEGRNQADAVFESFRILNKASTSEEILADFTLLQKGGSFTNQAETPTLSNTFSSLERERSNLPDNTLVLLDFNGNISNKARQGLLATREAPIVDTTRASNRVDFTITVPSNTFVDRQLLETVLRNFTPVDLEIKVDYIEVD